MKKFFAFALILLFSSSYSGWAQTTDTPSSTEESSTAPPPANIWTTVEGGVYFTCPVMKGEAPVELAEGYTDLNGARYYHCCPPCQAPFRANPDRWLSELALPANIVRINSHGHKVFRDPVNRQEGEVREDTPHADLDRRRYYFSSEENRESFSENPESYLAEFSE